MARIVGVMQVGSMVQVYRPWAVRPDYRRVIGVVVAQDASRPTAVTLTDGIATTQYEVRYWLNDYEVRV